VTFGILLEPIFLVFFSNFGVFALMKSAKTIKELCDVVRQTAYDIHVYHGNGHLEKVYENALANRLRKLGIEARQQHPVNVYDEDGTMLGEYFADLIIESRLLVELKAVREVAPEHVSQILGYLKSSKIEDGLLINFGSSRFQIKKYILNDRLCNDLIQNFGGKVGE
jgi:GxxExxY protein